MMLFSSTALSLLGLFTAASSATSLTYRVPAGAQECFYAHVDNPGAKISFYFAVQAGGSFDIDYRVYGPGNAPGRNHIILEGDKERQGDFAFTANDRGEYEFCFDNSISTFAEKLVDFDITVSYTFGIPSKKGNEVENETRAALPQKAGASTEQLGTVEEAVLRLSSQIATLSRQQKYFRTRENRNFSTVRSTEKRIWNFSLMESGLMIAMACLQVFVVKMFFTGGRKGYV